VSARPLPSLSAALAALLAATAAAAPPEATRIFPPGVRRGATVTVKVAGSFPVWPVTVWSERPGLQWEPQADPGTFAVTAAADAPLGVHLPRFVSPEGASAPRRFVVGHLPESVESEPNDRVAEAGTVEALPAVVSGVLASSGDADCHRVRLAAGERLVAQADAHRLLRSPADLVLDVVDARGNVLARTLDAAGLDPRVSVVAPADGDYVVRVWGFPETPDSTIGLAGGETFVYRLSIGRGAFLVGTEPSALTAGGEAVVRPLGAGLDGAAAVPLVARGMTAPGTLWVALDGVAGMAEVAVTPLAVVAAGADAVAPPVVFTGVVNASGETRAHRFTTTKEGKLTLLLEGTAIGTLLDPLLAIRDPAGAIVASTDDPAARIAWNPPADGTFVAEVRDRRGQGSPAHGYRLTIRPDQPRVALSAAIDRIAGKTGTALEVPLAVEREHGYGEILDIVLVDPPPGVTAAAIQSPAEGDAAKKVALSITAAAPLSAPVRVAARVAGKPDAPPLPVRFGPEGLDTLWLGVTPP